MLIGAYWWVFRSRGKHMCDLTKYVLIQHKNYTTKAFPPQDGCTALLGRPLDLKHIKRTSSKSKYSRSYAHPMFDVEITPIGCKFWYGLPHYDSDGTCC